MFFVLSFKHHQNWFLSLFCPLNVLIQLLILQNIKTLWMISMFINFDETLMCYISRCLWDKRWSYWKYGMQCLKGVDQSVYFTRLRQLALDFTLKLIINPCEEQVVSRETEKNSKNTPTREVIGFSKHVLCFYSSCMNL